MATPCLSDTATVASTLTGAGQFAASVKVSPAGGNLLSARSDGLYAGTLTTGNVFPAAPVDGQLFALSPGVGVNWLFRYSAGVGVTNKWLYIGGGSLLADSQNAATLTAGIVAGSWYDMASLGPGAVSVSVPVAGVYSLRWGANLRAASGSDDTVSLGVGIAGSSPVASLTVDFRNAVAVNTAGVSRVAQASIGTSASFKLWISSSAGLSVSAYGRYLEVEPVRCG